MNEDQTFLAQAAALAAAVDPHQTAPNPRVGCVVVRDGQIIAQGVHQQYGGPHAEAAALAALDDLSDETVYVTLEPCDDFEGKQTPSCTQNLINKKCKKVVIGALDPIFSGQNVQKLRDAGVVVTVLDDPVCAALNPFFSQGVSAQRPYVLLKMAMTLDGQVVDPEISWISSKESRAHVHQLRAQYSGILTTTGTILADDPQLNCRVEGALSHPVSDPQVVIVGQRDIPDRAKVRDFDRLVHQVKSHDIQEIMDFCSEQKIDSLLTECGPTFATALLQAGVVDEILFFIAPRIIGGEGPRFTDQVDLSEFNLVEQRDSGGDVVLRYKKEYVIASPDLSGRGNLR